MDSKPFFLYWSYFFGSSMAACRNGFVNNGVTNPRVIHHNDFIPNVACSPPLLEEILALRDVAGLVYFHSLLAIEI